MKMGVFEAKRGFEIFAVIVVRVLVSKKKINASGKIGNLYAFLLVVLCHHTSITLDANQIVLVNIMVFAPILTSLYRTNWN